MVHAQGLLDWVLPAAQHSEELHDELFEGEVVVEVGVCVFVEQEPKALVVDDFLYLADVLVVVDVLWLET